MISSGLNKIVESWNPVLSKGAKFKNERIKRATALMLQNEAVYLQQAGLAKNATAATINEANTTTYSLNRADGYTNSGDFEKIAIPMVRRTFPELIAHEIVGVQPMSGPVGIAFALRFKAVQTYNAPQISPNHVPDNELGYNNIDPGYSGTNPAYDAIDQAYDPTGNVPSGADIYGNKVQTNGMLTTVGEALGSKEDPDITTNPTMAHGLGIGTGAVAHEVGFTIEKQHVEAATRKLRSRWSLEVAQDVKAMHGFDLEEEMMDILAYEITAEIDREIVNCIRAAANRNKLSNIGAGAMPVIDWNNTAQLDGRWEHEKYRNIYNMIIRKANRIAIDTRRGPGNFIVANPTLAAALEASSAFVIAPVETDVTTGQQGVTFLGDLGGRLRVYLDTFCMQDEVVIGYKGPSPYDSGIIYLPYIQLLVSKATFEDSFNPAIGLMSRYAIQNNLFGAHNYYVRCMFQNMP